MKLKLALIAVVVTFFSLITDVHAQRGGMGGTSMMNNARDMKYLHEHFDEFGDGKKARLSRYYVGISKPFMNVDVNQHYIAPAMLPIPMPSVAPTDVTVETKTSAHKTLGVYAGTFFPFIPTGISSAIGLDVGVNGGIFTTSIGPVSYGKNVINFSDNGSAMYFNLPLVMCIKSGGEVSMSKHDKEMLSLGFGVAPSLVSGKIIDNTMQVNLKKFVMLEVGAFTGIAWKIRAAYYPGSYKLVNSKDVLMAGLSNYSGPGDGSLDVVAQTSNEFSVSLVLLPFAYKWSDD